MVELRLDSIEDLGMPQDCYVSVRVGETQKLSRLSNSRIYRFPKTADRRYGKIEVFRRIGTCSVDVDPSNEDLRDLSIDCGEAGFGTLGLKVAVTGDVKAGADPIAVKKEGNKVRAAKDYLSKHGLEVRLAEAMQTVLREQPADPAGYLAGMLLQGRGAAGGVRLPPPKQEDKPEMAKLTGEPEKATLKPVMLEPPQPTTAPAPKLAAAEPQAILPFKDYYKANFGSVGGDALSKCYSKFHVKMSKSAASPVAEQAPVAAKVPSHLKPSVGTWLSSIPRSVRVADAGTASAAPVQAVAVAKTAVATFKLKPSVGTWLAPRLPAVKEEKAESKVEAVAVKAPPTKFNFKPSVGTWLAPRAPAKQEEVASPPCSPVVEKDPGAAQTELVAYKKMPSVGTWVGRIPRRLQQQVSSTAPAPAQTLAEPASKDVDGTGRVHEPSVGTRLSAPATKFNFKPSVGTWIVPRAAPAKEEQVASPPCPPAVEKDPGVAQTALVSYKKTPSVGTWMGRIPRRLQQQQVSSAAEAPAHTVAEPASKDVASMGWVHKPSVGTWLSAKPVGAPCQPAPAPCPARLVDQKLGFATKPSVGTWLAKRPSPPRRDEQKPCFMKKPSVGTWLAPRRV